MVKLIPETYFAPIDLPATFGRIAPLQVDLGCGEGSFLFELARRNPQKNYLGTEKLAGRVERVCRKTAILGNVRVLNVESSYAVRFLLPQDSVETFYLMFPDPWPKRRHQRRRVVTSHFLDSIHRTLERAGTLRIATDQPDYFEQIERTARNHSGFSIADLDEVHLPTTKFEKRFREQGAHIYRLSLRKISPLT